MTFAPTESDESVAEPRSEPWLQVRWQTIAFAAFVVAAALLRVIAVFRYRIDSDEPQHLHVVWAWANGLLPYRDVFDNHMPLFHMLFAPLLRVLGERADALIAMRLAMLALYAVMIALTFRIATRCYPRRIAYWSTVVAALFPLFLLWSVEFRTDDLWTIFWLASIAVLVAAPLTTSRVAASGFLLGLAAAVSAKTTLLLLAIAVGAACVGRKNAIRNIVAFLTTFLIPPAAIALFFAVRGAWGPFVYGVITHNLAYHARAPRLFLFPLLLIAIGIVAQRVGGAPQRRFLFVTTHFYGAALYCLWPLVEHEHWLPYFPLAAITLVPMLFTYRRVMGIVLAEIVLVAAIGRFDRNETRDGLSVIDQTLQLTTPADFVMDLKGETVFRRRAFFFVLEPMTKRRIRAGKIADTIIADILRTHTMVVGPDLHGYPKTDRAFIEKNFVLVGAVRVPGQILHASTFHIDVPAEYAIIGRTEAFAGALDGVPYKGPRQLTAGTHTISPVPPASFALLWSRAANGGFAPFAYVGARTGTRGSHCRSR